MSARSRSTGQALLIPEIVELDEATVEKLHDRAEELASFGLAIDSFGPGAIAVRETPSLRSIPVVMLTSSREEPDLVRAYEMGVNAYVVKPVDFKDFVAAISDLGVFWAVLNEPPPGSLRLKRTRRNEDKND